jgi:DNA processing protein
MSMEESKSLAFLSSVAGIGQQTLWKIQAALRAASVSQSALLPATSNLSSSRQTTPEETWKQFWVLGSSRWRKWGISDMQIAAIERRKKEQTIDVYSDWLQRHQIRVVHFDTSEYPPLLREIENPPLILFAKGSSMNWNTGPPVAVVGTRHMTEYGKRVTEKITSELVLNGAQIVSGFMYGVDICAHRSALDWEGQTIGVLGYGFTYVYPKSYTSTFLEFLERGMTFITPFAPDVAPTKGNFPARNAIVAGMSKAVVVTEAAEKSGTHITAGYAADFGRSVYAVPGSIFSPYSRGVKALINQGATLIDSGEEVTASSVDIS